MTGRSAVCVGAALLAGCGAQPAGDAPTPSGRYLVYTKNVGQRGEAIWIGDVDGRRMRRLVRGFGGLVSPDGRKVAFHRCSGSFSDCQIGEGRSVVYVVDPDGTKARRLDGISTAEQWFPDSRHLLARARAHLVRVDADGGERNVLVGRAKLLRGWSVGGDGRVAYALARTADPWGLCREHVDVYVVDADGGGRRRLTSDGRNSDPVWAGTRIAYARHAVRRECLAPAAGISTMRPDGSGKRPIVAQAPRRFSRGGYYGLRPYGAVRGRSLLLAGALTEWGDELVVVDLRTGRIRRADLDGRSPLISPMYVQYTSRDGRYGLGTACGAEFPCSINIYSVLDGRGRTIASGRVGDAHWNR